MAAALSDLTQQLLDNAIAQVQKPDNKARIRQHLVDPVIGYVMERVWPVLLGCSIVFALVTLLTLICLFLVVYDRLKR